MSGLDHVAGLLERCTDSTGCRTVCSRAYYVTFRTLIIVCGPIGFRRNEFNQPGQKHVGVHRRLFNFMRDSSKPALQRIARLRIEDLYSLRIHADYTFDAPITRVQAKEALALAQDIHDWVTDSGLLPPTA